MEKKIEFEKVCPHCGKELWKTKTAAFQLQSPVNPNDFQQFVGQILYCPDGDVMDDGCGYVAVEIKD